MHKKHKMAILARLFGLLVGLICVIFCVNTVLFAQEVPYTPFTAQRETTFRSVSLHDRSIFDRLHTLAESIGYGRGDRFVFRSPRSNPLNDDAVLMLGQTKMRPERLISFRKRPKNEAFFQGNGDWLRARENEKFEGFDADLYGMTLGIDRIFSRNLIIGLGGGCAFSDIHASSSSLTTSTSDSWITSAYGLWCENDWSVGSVVGFSYNRYESKAESTLLSIPDSTNHHGNLFFSSVEISRKMRLYCGDFTPFYHIQYQHLNESRHEENLNSVLKIDTEKSNRIRQMLGLRFGKRYSYNNRIVFDPQIEAAWLHDYTEAESSISWTENGIPNIYSPGIPSRNRAHLSLLLNVRFSRNRVIFCRYSAELASHYETHGLVIGYNFAF